MENSGRFAGIERKTVWFVVGAGVALLLVLGVVAFKQDYFSQTTTLLFFSPNAQGLNKGMSVKFIGFKVGKVDDVLMEPNATVKVRLEVNNDYIHFIGQDAKARLMKEALVGESVIEIVPGSEQARQIAQNSVLAFEREQEISEITGQLASQIRPILDDVKKITSSISGSGGDIQQTLKNMNQVSANLVQLTRNGEGKVDTVLGRLDTTLATANHALKTLDDAMPGMVLKADSTLGNVNAASAEIEKMVAPTGPVPQMLDNGSVLIEDSREIMDGAKKSWPLRTMLPPAGEAVLPLDGYSPPVTQGRKP